MAEQKPCWSDERTFFQEICDAPGPRNPAIRALDFKNDPQAARMFFRGYVEEFAAKPLPDSISAENRNPVRLARAAISSLVQVRFYAEEGRWPEQSELDANLGVYKEIFTEHGSDG